MVFDLEASGGIPRNHHCVERLCWLIVALCDVGAEINRVIGWNAAKDREAPSVEEEFATHLRFLREHVIKL